MPDVLITETALASLLPHAERIDCLKLLNIGIACKAVQMLVHTNMSDGVSLDTSREAFTHKVVAISLNVNALLCLALAEEAMQSLPHGPTETWNCKPSTFNTFAINRLVNNDIYWGDAAHTIVNEQRTWQIAFRMQASALGSAMEPEDASASDARFLDKGFSEPYVPVQVQGVLFSRHFFLIRNVSRLTSLFFLRLISDSLPLSMFLSDLMKTTILLLAKNPPNKY